MYSTAISYLNNLIFKVNSKHLTFFIMTCPSQLESQETDVPEVVPKTLIHKKSAMSELEDLENEIAALPKKIVRRLLRCIMIKRSIGIVGGKSGAGD